MPFSMLMTIMFQGRSDMLIDIYMPFVALLISWLQFKWGFPWSLPLFSVWQESVLVWSLWVQWPSVHMYLFLGVQNHSVLVNIQGQNLTVKYVNFFIYLFFDTHTHTQKCICIWHCNSPELPKNLCWSCTKLCLSIELYMHCRIYRIYWFVAIVFLCQGVSILHF